MSVPTLEEYVTRIERSLGGAAWSVGRDLTMIKKRKLWSPAYLSFNAFVIGRLGRTPYWAGNHIRIVKAFSESTLGRLGASKAIAILRAHPGRRALLVQEASRLTKQELEARVASYNTVDGFTGETDHSRRASQSAKRKVPRAGMRSAMESILREAQANRMDRVIELAQSALGAP